jgi:hypothetical protein
MYGTQPHPSEGVRSSNFQLDTPNGRNPDDSYVAERRRNYLVDIGFDPVESHQQPLHPPLPLRDRSEIKGASAVVLQDAPKALYFHFMMHCLNLRAAESVKLPLIRNCLDLLREIINFFAYSATRNHVLQKKIEETQQNSKSLKKLCETRFVEKHSSVLTISATCHGTASRM